MNKKADTRDQPTNAGIAVILLVIVFLGVVILFGGRSADALRQMVSCSSSTPPSFASTTLNTETAAVAFSTTYAGTGSSANNSANCVIP